MQCREGHLSCAHWLLTGCTPTAIPQSTPPTLQCNKSCPAHGLALAPSPHHYRCVSTGLTLPPRSSSSSSERPRCVSCAPPPSPSPSSSGSCMGLEASECISGWMGTPVLDTSQRRVRQVARPAWPPCKLQPLSPTPPPGPSATTAPAPASPPQQQQQHPHPLRSSSSSSSSSSRDRKSGG